MFIETKYHIIKIAWLAILHTNLHLDLQIEMAHNEKAAWGIV